MQIGKWTSVVAGVVLAWGAPFESVATLSANNTPKERRRKQ